MEIEKSIFFLCSIPYLDIILRPSMFLESSISTSNLPKSSKMYLRRYWRNRQPVLANSPTGIGQFANRYWPIRQPVLTKSSTGIGQFANRYWRIWQYIHINNAYSYCRHAEIANRYWPIRQPVLTNSPTGIDQFANRYWPIRQPVLAKSTTGIDEITNHWTKERVGNLINTGWQFGQYRLVILSIPVGDFRMSAMVHFEQVCHYLMRTFTFNRVWPIIYQLKVPFRSEKKLT